MGIYIWKLCITKIVSEKPNFEKLQLDLTFLSAIWFGFINILGFMHHLNQLNQVLSPLMPF